MRKLFSVLVVSFLFVAPSAWAQKDKIDLSGKWGFQLDATDFERAFENSGAHKDLLNDQVTLPGTTDSNKKGIQTTNKPINRLSRYYEYVGPAWYQKEVVIPESWEGKSIELELERILWMSSLYIDGKLVNSVKSFSTAHIYDLSKVLRPGKHRISICVDNRVGPEFDRWSHAFSEYTQTCWNGIVGQMELRAYDAVNIKDIQVYSDIDKKQARVVCTIENLTNKEVKGSLSMSATTTNSSKMHQVKGINIPFGGSDKMIKAEVVLPMGKDVQLWDEFTPVLYDLKASLYANVEDAQFSNTKNVVFGMRSFGSDGSKFTLNNRKIFLRGTLECGIFPLTGYPDMTVEGWLRICNIVKSYGLNHIRFHSWCPPKQAFIAADQTGILLQVELPFWGEATKKSDPLSLFLHDEMANILKAYGNHPSFVMLCMGNELRGNFDVMADLVDFGKATDSRHLYSGSTARKHLDQDQYYVSHVTSAGGITTYGARGPQTDYDLRKAYDVLKVPGVAHEVGQRAVYPNFDEIKKYTGVLYPRNFELFRDSLIKHGMMDQAKDFFNVSGNMTVMLYKESIEALLRTPNSGGFQLLDLHDFPGQGTALVGILDPFWDSKGFVAPEKFREFCSPTVPILRLKKREYFTTDTLVAAAELFHYGLKPIEAPLTWDIRKEDGKVVAAGKFSKQVIQPSCLAELGNVQASLRSIGVAQKLTVTIYVGKSVKNSWDIWVYPTSTIPEAGGYVVAKTMDDATISALNAGKKVLLLPDIKQLNGKVGDFQNHFWCPIMFRWDPMTMGTLVNHHHPAFKHFPSSFFTEWQWWNIIENSVSLNLDQAPVDLRPLLQPIDTYDRCLKLGVIFEAKVGRGKLLMASIDFEKNMENRPAAQELLKSLKEYVASSDFAPNNQLTVEFIQGLFKKPTLLTGAKIVKCDSYETGNEPDKMIDGNPNTIWHTAYNNPGNFAVTNKQTETNYPHEVQIELANDVDFSGFTYVPRTDGENGLISSYAFYISNDGKNWGDPVVKGSFNQSVDPTNVLFKAKVKAKYIRFVALSGFDGQKWASMADLELIP